MSTSRRRFLKAAGLTVLGVGGSAPFIAARARGASTEAAPDQLRGKRWALAIDTKKCARDQGCTACVDACHTEHNVPDIGDPKEEVKWIWKEEVEHALHEALNEHSPEELRRRNTLVLCNHCDNPPCVRVCPTKATFKRADGPVMMDMHRCIGCRYCVVGCPYGARSFNWKDPRPYIKQLNEQYPTRSRGVVEKCTLCPERLARGQIPACVEACQQSGSGAMLFGDMADQSSEIYQFVRSNYSVRRKEHLGTRPQVFYVL